MKPIKTIITLFFIITLFISCKTEPKPVPSYQKEPPEATIEAPHKTAIKDPTVNSRNSHYDNMIKEAIDEALKKSGRVNIDSIAKDLVLIKDRSFYKILIGDSIASHQEKLKTEVLKHGEINLSVFVIYGKNNTKLAIVYPDPEKKDIISSIKIISEEPKTENGISVGMTYGDLLKKSSEIIINKSEVNGLTSAKNGNISYLLNIPYNPTMIKISQVKNTAKIKSITID